MQSFVKSEDILNGKKKLTCDCLKEKSNPNQEKNIDYLLLKEVISIQYKNETFKFKIHSL